MSINTKNFIKAIRPAVVDAGIAEQVKRVLNREFGLGFQTPTYDHDRLRDRKVFKLAPGYPETLDTTRVRNLAREIPGTYPQVRRAVDLATGSDTLTTTSPADTSTGDVPVADLVALLREHGERNDWCGSAEQTMEDHLGLHFVDVFGGDRYTLTGDNPTTVTRQALAEYIRRVDRDYGATTGVQSFLDELGRRWPVNAAASTSTQAQTSNGRYTVNVVADLDRRQLEAIGWDGARPMFDFSYGGVNGRATVQAAH